jgi:hypothetical protein
MVVEKPHEIVERLTKRRRRDRRIAPHAEIAGLELLAEPEAEIALAEMTGADLARGLLKQAAVGRQLDLERWRTGHVRRDPGIAEDGIHVAALRLDEVDQAGRRCCQDDGRAVRRDRRVGLQQSERHCRCPIQPGSAVNDCMPAATASSGTGWRDNRVPAGRAPARRRIGHPAVKIAASRVKRWGRSRV